MTNVTEQETNYYLRYKSIHNQNLKPNKYEGGEQIVERVFQTSCPPQLTPSLAVNLKVVQG